MTRTEWIDRAERRLDEWDTAVGRLEAKAEGVERTAGSELHERLGAAKTSLREAHAHYRRARESANETWETVSEEIGTAWDANEEALERSLEAARSAVP